MAKKIKLDFSKVEERSGWNTKGIPEGVHKMRVADVQETEAGDGTPMLVYSLIPADPRYKTRNFPFYCKLQQNQLWKLRDLIVAAGGTVPKKLGLVDPNGPVGKFIAAEVSDETGQYAGRSTVDNTYGLDILDDDADDSASNEDDEEYEGDEDEAGDDEDEEEEYEEDDEEDEEEDLEALSLAELRKRAKESEIVTTGLKKAQLIEAILEAEAEEDEDEDDLDDEDLEDDDLDEEELEDDEDEEEEPAPKARKAPARKPAAKAAAPKRSVRRR
jgi:hypothetical protein